MMKDDLIEYLCPYCGCRMEEGTFRRRGGNYSLPIGQKAPLAYSQSSFEGRGAIMLPPDAFSTKPPTWPKAYVCRNCKKIILSY
ncbi:PF20097 family protein [Mahella sp.]|uniref:PF20097 family protein n=1 Tax=Mahella sp. TaxID=2798721 RepID=UPI00343941FE